MAFIISLIFGGLEAFVLWEEPGFASSNIILGSALVGALALAILVAAVSHFSDDIDDLSIPCYIGYIIGYFGGTVNLADKMDASFIQRCFMFFLPQILGGLLLFGIAKAFGVSKNALFPSKKTFRKSGRSTNSQAYTDSYVRDIIDSSDYNTNKNTGFGSTSYRFEDDFIGGKKAIGADGTTYRFEDDLIPGDKVIRDSSGKRVGRVETDIITGRKTFYDDYGNKQGYMTDDIFDPYNKVYDKDGNQVGEYDSGYFGFGSNYKPKK